MLRYYLDTEFNGFGGAMISLALVCEDGRSLYLLNSDLHDLREAIDPWVAKNVLPHLHKVPDHVKPVRAHLDEWGYTISDFLYGRGEPPQIIADWPSDIADLCNLLLVGPGQSAPMEHQTHFTVVRHIDVYPTDLEGAVQHNALWDALALKRYIELSESAG